MSRNTCTEASTLPMGYRFHPTDEELIYYLLCMVNGEPFPFDGILSERDIYCEQELQNTFDGHTGETLYIITKLRRKTKTGTRIERSVGKGTWKGEQCHSVKHSRICSTIGYVRRFVYKSKESKENNLWIMKEYSLAGEYLRRAREMGWEDYVLCRLKKKKKKDLVDLDSEDAVIPEKSVKQNRPFHLVPGPPPK